MSVFGSNYGFEQLFTIIKSVKSRTITRLTDGHLEGCTRITTEIKYDVLPKDYSITSNAK
jgi:hypothetical protein